MQRPEETLAAWQKATAGSQRSRCKGTGQNRRQGLVTEHRPQRKAQGCQDQKTHRNKNNRLEEPKKKKRKSSIAGCAQLQQIRLGKGASEKLQ